MKSAQLIEVTPSDSLQFVKIKAGVFGYLYLRSSLSPTEGKPSQVIVKVNNLKQRLTSLKTKPTDSKVTKVILCSILEKTVESRFASTSLRSSH